jgi:O-antigen ligase
MFFAIYFKRNGYKAVIVGAIFFLIASATFMNSIVKDTVNLDDPSTAAHALAYTVGIESILQHPLGLGLGKAGPVANQLGAANMYALGSSNANGDTEAGVGESLYLTLTMEKGIPALIFFLSFIGGLIYQAKRVRVLAKNEQKLLGYTIYFSTIIFLIASIPTEHWFGFQSSCIYWWFSGIMCQIYSNSFLNIKEVLPA